MKSSTTPVVEAVQFERLRAVKSKGRYAGNAVYAVKSRPGELYRRIGRPNKDVARARGVVATYWDGAFVYLERWLEGEAELREGGYGNALAGEGFLRVEEAVRPSGEGFKIDGKLRLEEGLRVEEAVRPSEPEPAALWDQVQTAPSTLPSQIPVTQLAPTDGMLPADAVGEKTAAELLEAGGGE